MFAILATLLGENARAEVSTALREALLAPATKVRLAAISLIARGKDATARAVLEPLLLDQDPAVRATVVDALGTLADPEALRALVPLAADADKTVQLVLARVLPALQSVRVQVFIGQGLDFSGAREGLADELRAQTRAALKHKLGVAFVLHEDASKESFGAAPIALRSIVTRLEGNVTFVDVKCELTVVSMPSNILRAALSATASVGVEGPVDDALTDELARDGIAACAPALAGDFASYVKGHARR